MSYDDRSRDTSNYGRSSNRRDDYRKENRTVNYGYEDRRTNRDDYRNGFFQFHKPKIFL